MDRALGEQNGERFQLSPAFRARYEILELIGKGGMGAVYRARQEGTDRDVAIKFMAGNLFEGDDTEARFLNEARTLASLHHPHLVMVIEAGRDGCTPFIVFEYVPGSTVKKEVSDRGHYPVFEALRVAAETSSALKEAHAKGIVHRDIKSENILLDPEGRVKVADFGIAKSDQGAHTQTGVIVGTPAYMAPEQAMNKPLDARTDVYSTGIVLFEMLTGRLPFGDENSMATMMAHINEPVPAPSYLVPGLPELLDELLAGALAKAPEDRYPSAGAFAIAINHAARKLRELGFEGAEGTAAHALAAAPGGPPGSTSRVPSPPGSPDLAGATRAARLPTSGAAGTTAAGVAPRSATRAAPTPRVLSTTTVAAGKALASPTAWAPAPSPATGFRRALLFGGAALLLVLGVGIGVVLTRPSDRVPAALEGGEPHVREVREILADALSEDAEPEVRAVLLRSQLPAKVGPEQEELRAAVVERLRDFRETTYLEEDEDLPVLLALGALGDQDAYGEALARAFRDVGEPGDGMLRARVLEALEQGLARGRIPTHEPLEDLSDQLWRVSPDRNTPARAQEAFFACARRLGDAGTVRNLAGYLDPEARRLHPRELVRAASDALRSLSESDRPGAEAARERVAGGLLDDAAQDLGFTDEESLEGVRALVDSGYFDEGDGSPP